MEKPNAEVSPAVRYEWGRVRLTRFVDGWFTFEAPARQPDWSVPAYAPATDTARLDFAAYGLEVDGHRIIVDPWLVTDGARQAPGATAHGDRLQRELDDAGFAAASVDLVIFTHLDGIGWSVCPGADGPVPMFPHARHVLTRSGMDAWRSGVIDGVDELAVLVDAGLVDEVACDATVTPSVTLRPTEGHTAGHAVVQVRDPAGDLALAGHLVQLPSQVADPAEPTPGLDAVPGQAAVERRVLLADLARTGGVLFGQILGGCGGGAVIADGAGYRLVPRAGGHVA